MDSKTLARLAIVLVAVTIGIASRSVVAAEPPSAAQALGLKPMQDGVEYSIPTAEEAARCTVKLERENNVTDWVVTNSKGEVLRRFYDTNGDNYVDMWCYYLGGLEVYRDIDSNFNNHADQYRWFNTAGTRWAIDKNEDGKIDYWNVISPHEVAEQVMLALKNRNQAQFELVLISPSDLNGLGFGEARKNSISENIKAAPAAFSKIVAEQKVITDKS